MRWLPWRVRGLPLSPLHQLWVSNSCSKCELWCAATELRQWILKEHCVYADCQFPLGILSFLAADKVLYQLGVLLSEKVFFPPKVWSSFKGEVIFTLQVKSPDFFSSLLRSFTSSLRYSTKHRSNVHCPAPVSLNRNPINNYMATLDCLRLLNCCSMQIRKLCQNMLLSFNAS